MQKYILGFIMVLSSLGKTIKAQDIDTLLVLRHLKVRLFIEVKLGYLSELALDDYFKRKLEVSILGSKGFENFIFFKISDQILAVDTLKENKRIATYKMPLCLKNGGECYFVYAYNKDNHGFYKLKGTSENDFPYLYNSLRDKWINWKPIKNIDKSTIDSFINDHLVEGLDISCLITSLKVKKGNCLDYYSPEIETE